MARAVGMTANCAERSARKDARARVATRWGAVSALVLLGLSIAPAWAAAQALQTVDIAELSTAGDHLRRVHGSVGDGSRGVPVAGGGDVDGDGFVDYAMASMQASVLGRAVAGEVYLVFGDGTVSGSLDTAPFQADVLKIAGAGPSETAGSVLWMDDVTGDGLADLLVARQNYTHTPDDPDRTGAGALTILVGGGAVRSFAETAAGLSEHLDLAAPPPATLALATFVGAAAFDRLGIWVRTGDVTGDGVADIAVGADQASDLGVSHHGAVYLIRGGAQLAATQTIDLAEFGAGALDGHVARVDQPSGSGHFHFGGTCQIADLDGNGRAELLAAAALNRASAGILAHMAPSGSAHASGGSPDGTVYVGWDDNFTAIPWPTGYRFSIDAAPGSQSVIDGGACNISFGEELLGGLDYDHDDAPDLFVGDLAGDCSGQGRAFSGVGHVLYGASSLKGLVFDLDAPPPSLVTATFLGGAAGHIAADTAAHGDFDGDGRDDLASCSPRASPLGRIWAGTVHVFFGRPGPWPATVDLAPGLPRPPGLRSADVHGAEGTVGADAGDTLCYSAAAGHVDGDGRIDLIINEMLGDGLLPAAEDTGNLIVLSGAIFAPNPVPGLRPAGAALACALILASGVAAVARRGRCASSGATR